MSAVINDSRNTIPAIAGASGMAICAYIQAQISLVGPNDLVYRIATEDENLAAYVVLRVQDGGASKLLYQPRPAFQSFQTQISGIISKFIVENAFLQDFLY